jgi:hypothetical protein
MAIITSPIPTVRMCFRGISLESRRKEQRRQVAGVTPDGFAGVGPGLGKFPGDLMLSDAQTGATKLGC